MPSGRHFNVTGSNTVKKCQRANGSQSLLQHTWLALQLSEICLHWSWKKEIFIIWNKLQSPRAKSFKMSMCSSVWVRGLRINGGGQSQWLWQLIPYVDALTTALSRNIGAQAGTPVGNDFNKRNLWNFSSKWGLSVKSRKPGSQWSTRSRI